MYIYIYIHIYIYIYILRTLTRDRRTLEGVSAIGLLRLCAHSWLDLCSLLHLWSFFKKKTKKGEGCTRVERKCLDRRPKWREAEAVFAKLGLRKEIRNDIESLENHRTNLWKLLKNRWKIIKNVEKRQNKIRPDFGGILERCLMIFAPIGLFYFELKL